MHRRRPNLTATSRVWFVGVRAVLALVRKYLAETIQTARCMDVLGFWKEIKFGSVLDKEQLALGSKFDCQTRLCSVSASVFAYDTRVLHRAFERDKS